MMDAIAGAWVNAVGGEAIIGLLCSLIFVFMFVFVFFKITN